MTASRDDTDTWDLTTSVGATATVVAAARAAAARPGGTGKALIDDPFAERLVAAVGIDFLTRWARGRLDPAEAALPVVFGFTTLMAARTRYFDDYLLQACDPSGGGIGQVVVLASGLDARAYRLAWPVGTVLYEVDQPDVVDFKAGVLADAAPRAERRSVPVDLRDDWAAALLAAGFTPGRPSVWLAEGLLPYLHPDDQNRLLDRVGELSAPGSRIATEIFVPPNPEFMRPLSHRWHRQGFDTEMSELVYPGPRTDVGAHLDTHGWRSDTVPMTRLLAEYGLDPDGGRELFVKNVYCTATRVAGGLLD